MPGEWEGSAPILQGQMKELHLLDHWRLPRCHASGDVGIGAAANSCPPQLTGHPEEWQPRFSA